jgi:segregation and condensation protein B
MEIKKIIEALLFAANAPMTAKQLQQLFPETDRPETRLIQNAIESLMMDYSIRAVELKSLGSGYRFQVRAEFAPWVATLFEEKPPHYSRALLETLAIIAYQQPVTRGDIEEIRGVSVSSSLINTLLEREWIHRVGQKQVPGLPTLYATTPQFLDYFNLSSLSQLPSLTELKQGDTAMMTLQHTPQVNREEPPQQQPPTADSAQKTNPQTGRKTSEIR